MKILFSISRTKWTARMGGLAGSLLLAASSARAATIDFDSAGYVSGERPPAPWTDENIHAGGGSSPNPVAFTVQAGVGVGGSQALQMGCNPGYFAPYAVYVLPKPLMPADGAQRISVKLDPSGPAPNANFLTYGGAWIGDGWKLTDANSVGIYFYLEDWSMYTPHSPTDYGVMSGAGGMGQFVPSSGPDFHELVFEINAAWNQIQYTVVFPDGHTLSNSGAWRGTSIDKVWLRQADSETYMSPPPVYDDLVVGSGKPPTIVEAPASQTATTGGSVTFHVNAEGGDGVTYQWRLNSTPIAGATNDTYTIAAVGPEQAGAYSVVVTNADGSTTSAAATLSLLNVDTAAVLTLWGPVGTTYRIDYALDITEPVAWQLLTNLTVSTSPTVWVDFGSTHSAKRYYRTVAE